VAGVVTRTAAGMVAAFATFTLNAAVA